MDTGAQAVAPTMTDVVRHAVRTKARVTTMFKRI